MFKKRFVHVAAAVGVCLAAAASALTQTDHSTHGAAAGVATENSKGAAMAPITAQTGYAPVNGLTMYYEIHGAGRPLVLLHGALSTIDVDFGRVLPSLAQTRQVIAIEQQAHGHTADIDRPLTDEQMAEDTAALLRQLKIENADFLGYSIGAGIALEFARRQPDLVRKLVVASPAYRRDGVYSEIWEGIETSKPEDLA